MSLIKLARLFTLNACHQGDLLGALHDVRAVFLANQLAVLEEALVSGKSVSEIAECHQSQAPDPTASKFSFKSHAVRPEEDSAAMEPSLHEFTLVSVLLKNGTEKAKRQWTIYKQNRFQFVLLWAIRKIHNSQSATNAVHEGSIYDEKETGNIALLRTVITMKFFQIESKIATVTCSIWQQQMAHSVLLSFLIPVSDVTRTVIVPKAARFCDARLHWREKKTRTMSVENDTTTSIDTEESYFSIFGTRTLHSEAGSTSANVKWWQVRLKTRHYLFGFLLIELFRANFHFHFAEFSWLRFTCFAAFSSFHSLDSTYRTRITRGSKRRHMET